MLQRELHGDVLLEDHFVVQRDHFKDDSAIRLIISPISNAKETKIDLAQSGLIRSRLMPL
jgi:hypothetical protein